MGTNVENSNLHEENQGLYYENPELTEGEITALSTLVYIGNYKWNKEDSSVADIINYLLNDGYKGLKREERKPSEKQLREHPEKYPNGEFKETDLEKFPAGMSRTEWISFLLSVKKNEKLMSLKIVEFDSQEGAWEYFSVKS